MPRSPLHLFLCRQGVKRGHQEIESYQDDDNDDDSGVGDGHLEIEATKRTMMMTITKMPVTGFRARVSSWFQWDEEEEDEEQGGPVVDVKKRPDSSSSSSPLRSWMFSLV
jgi:hypothetical protein